MDGIELKGDGAAVEDSSQVAPVRKARKLRKRKLRAGELTAEELRAAFDRKEWNALWLQAMPIVNYALKKMRASGKLRGTQTDESSERNDLRAEGYLRVGEAVREWDPEKSPFFPWIKLSTTNAILDFNRSRAREGLTGDRKMRVKMRSFIEGDWRNEPNAPVPAVTPPTPNSDDLFSDDEIGAGIQEFDDGSAYPDGTGYYDREGNYLNCRDSDEETEWSLESFGEESSEDDDDVPVFDSSSFGSRLLNEQSEKDKYSNFDVVTVNSTAKGEKEGPYCPLGVALDDHDIDPFAKLPRMMELRDWLDALGKEDSELVRLKFGIDCVPEDLVELAERFGCSLATIKRRLDDATDKLKTLV